MLCCVVPCWVGTWNGVDAGELLRPQLVNRALFITCGNLSGGNARLSACLYSVRCDSPHSPDFRAGRRVPVTNTVDWHNITGDRASGPKSRIE